MSGLSINGSAPVAPATTPASAAAPAAKAPTAQPDASKGGSGDKNKAGKATLEAAAFTSLGEAMLAPVKKATEEMLAPSKVSSLSQGNAYYTGKKAV